MLRELKERGRYDTAFDANKALAGSFLAQLKTVDFDPRDLKQSRYMINELFNCAQTYEKNNNGALIDILDNLDQTGTDLFALDMALKPNEHWIKIFDGLSEQHRLSEDGDTFLSAALRRNLRTYCKIKLSLSSSMINEKPGRPLLDYVLRPNGIDHNGPFKLDVEILELLLKNGADPNRNWHDPTVWGYWLEYIAEYHEWAISAPLELVHPTRLLVANGAQEKVVLPANQGLQYASRMMGLAFGTKIANELENEFQKQKWRYSRRRIPRFSSWCKKFLSRQNSLRSWAQ